ncbi:MAG: PfkB family carbohydrate kinase, partial [Planctomycetota bacterium]
MSEMLYRRLEGMGRPAVTVVGDLMLDTYVWGEVSRVSPEGPIPVLHATEREHRPGGAAGVATMLSALGARVECVGAVADDRSGEDLRARLEDYDVDTSGIVTCTDRPTTVKTRYMGYVQSAGRSLQQMVRVDEEDCGALNEDDGEAIREAVAAADADFIVVQDMAKGLLNDALLQCLISDAREQGRRVLIDPRRGEDYSAYRGADYVLPNRRETEMATGIKPEGEEACRRAAERLLEDLSLEAALVTLDREGVFYAASDGIRRHVNTRAREVTDVTGAGDMVAAALGLALADGADLHCAVELANAAAGLEVGCQGAVPITRSRLLEELEARSDPAALKIKGRDEIGELMDEARAEGRRIVFTNGCFDLLHLGHVELIRYARAQGDLLVVGINDDESARRLKGPGRPVNTEDVRSRVLAALSDVDYVVPFPETSVLPLIKDVRPDVLVKGGDYTKEGVVGHDFVTGRGGEVKLAPEVDGFSTTQI